MAPVIVSHSRALERIGSIVFGVRAAAGGSAGAKRGAAAGSAGSGATEGGVSTVWVTRTAEAPSPTQKALHAVLIKRSIGSEISLQASAVPTRRHLEYVDNLGVPRIPGLTR